VKKEKVAFTVDEAVERVGLSREALIVEPPEEEKGLQGRDPWSRRKAEQGSSLALGVTVKLVQPAGLDQGRREELD
jgi:hypothetical protein